MRVPAGPRLDRLPLGRFHRRIMLALSFAFFFELADLNTFAYAAPGLIKFLGLRVADIATVTSAGFLGMFVGASCGGWLADRLGRRGALIWTVALYSVFSLSNALATGVVTLVAARLLTGIGLSAMTVIAITYLSEMMPKDQRGRVQAATLAMGLLGITVMAQVARLIVPTGPDGWRWVFVFGACGAFFLLMVRHLPESPRWFETRGDLARADAVVEAIEREAEREVGTLPPVKAQEPPPPAQRGLAVLFERRFGRRTVMLWLSWIFQTLGFYGFMAWVPTLLVAHGFGLVKSLAWASVTTLGAVPGALLAWPLSDRFRRKGPIVVLAVAIAVAGLLYGMSFNETAIEFFGFLVGFLIQTMAALLYAYTPEMYPTSVRNSGVGFAYGAGRLANVFGPAIVALLFVHYGYLSVFAYIAGTWLVLAALVGLLGPRTGDVSLEVLNAQQAPEGA